MDLKEIIDGIRPVSPEALSELKALLSPCSVKAKELIIEQGKVSRSVFFIRSGVFRNFSLHDGEEDTRWFALEGDLVASMFSFVNSLPAIASVQALTDADLYEMKISDAKELMERSFEWSRWTNAFLTDGLYALERRYLYIGTGDAMTRYRNMQSMRSFEMLQRVQLQYIASYLNMRPQTLSNIRKQLLQSPQQDQDFKEQQ